MWRLLAGFLLVTLTAPLVPRPVAEKLASDPWWTTAPLYRTKYYAFKTDLPEDDAKALAVHLDAVFESYMALFSNF